MKRSSPILHYGVAVLAVALVLVLRLVLAPLITQQSPFLLLAGAVMIAAWFGGLGPGLLATALGTLVADYFFLPPQGSFTGPGLHALPLVLFAVQGLVISSLTEALRTARGRAEASALEAESHQESLRRSEERFRALGQHSSDVITVIDADGTIRYVSPAVERVAGYHPEDLVGKSVFDYVRPENLEEGRNIFAELLSQPGVHPPFEFKVARKDGSWSHSEFLVNNLLDDPDVRAVVINQRDMTERKDAEHRLRESEELYRSVVEQAAENIFLVDAETRRVIRANATLHHSLGYGPEELRQLTLYDIVASDREDIDRNIRQILDVGRRFVGERQYRRKDGSLIDVEVNAGAISYGGRRALCVVAHDVTGRKKAEEALRRSLNALLALYETGQILSSSLERKEIGARLLEIMGRVSGSTAAVINLRDDEGSLCAWRTAGPESVLASVRSNPEAGVARRTVFETEEHRLLELSPSNPQTEPLVGVFLPLRARDRAIGVLEVYGPERVAESETLETFASLANQAASALENARLYEDLAERERQLHELVGRLLTAQEEERRRVAYDVHDGLAQTAAAAHQLLQAFARHHPPDSARAREELEEALELARLTVGEARQVIFDLRPTALDDFGLAAAVRLQAEALRSEGWDVGFEAALGDERLPPQVETTLFRVAQEALTNVRKHARASRVNVSLERLQGTVSLLIRDNGCGFRPDAVQRSNGPGERVGLSGMCERVSLLGGSCEIHSEPGAGASVVAKIPLSRSEEDADGR